MIENVVTSLINRDAVFCGMVFKGNTGLCKTTNTFNVTLKALNKNLHCFFVFWFTLTNINATKRLVCAYLDNFFSAYLIGILYAQSCRLDNPWKFALKKSIKSEFAPALKVNSVQVVWIERSGFFSKVMSLCNDSV